MTSGTRRARILMAVLTAALAASGRTLAQGCAMCGTAAGGPADPLARSLSASTLFMLSMPLALFLTVTGWLVWRFRHPKEDPR